MKTNEHITPDELFQSGLKGHEAGFRPEDWEHMLTLLEEDTTPLVPPVDKNHGKRKNSIFNLRNILIMSILITISSLVFLATTSEEPIINSTNLHHTNTAIEFAIDAESKEGETIKEDTYEEARAETTSSTVSQDGASSSTNMNKPEPVGDMPTSSVASPSFLNPSLITNEALKGLTSSIEKKQNMLKSVGDEIESVMQSNGPDTAQFYKRVTSRYWVDTTYVWKRHKNSRDIEDGWFGLYYSNQQLNDDMWDSLGRLTENHGFNIQFMSGNILPGENLAIYGGLDWGMQFYGRSDKDEVVINSVNEDRGVTFMRSHVNDIFITGQMEWAQTRFIPYVTASAGTRIFTTGQTVKALAESTEYERSTEDGLFTRAAFATKLGMGARIKLTSVMHLDMKYEFIQSGKMKVVDYGATKFDGLEYQVSTQQMDLNAHQWRVGLVFDVSYDEYKKEVDEPAHWEERTQELYLDPSDSSKIVIPCSDAPKENKKSGRTRKSTNGEIIDLPGASRPKSRRFDTWGSGGSSGSGSKSGFPGVKTPTIKH